MSQLPVNVDKHLLNADMAIIRNMKDSWDETSKFCSARLCRDDICMRYGFNYLWRSIYSISAVFYDEISRRIFLKLKTASRAFPWEMPTIFSWLCL